MKESKRNRRIDGGKKTIYRTVGVSFASSGPALGESGRESYQSFPRRLSAGREFQRDRNYPGGGIRIALRDSPTTSTARHDVSLYKLRGNSAEDSIPPRTFSSNSSFHRTLLYLRPIFVGTTSASPRLQIAFQRCSFSTAMRVTDMAQRISRCTRCSKGGKTGKISSAELSSLLGSKEILETRSFNPLVARLPPSLPCAIVREGI